MQHMFCLICLFVTQWRLRQHKDDADHKNPGKGDQKTILIDLVRISFSFYFVFMSSI